MRRIIRSIRRLFKKIGRVFDRVIFDKIRKLFINCNFDLIQWILKVLILFFAKLGLILTLRYHRYLIGYYKEINDNIDELESKNIFHKRKVYNDILLSRIIYGIRPQEYFVFKYYKLSYLGRRNFLTFHRRTKMLRKLNDYNYVDYFNFKPATYEKFNKFFKRDALVITSDLTFDELKSFAEKHDEAIYKPANDFGGSGVELVKFSELDLNEEYFEEIVEKGYAILEEKIKQDPKLAVFHEGSVNTVRVVTYLNSEDELDYLWAFLRMGSGGSLVDNMSAGGIAAFLDPKEGVIIEQGKDYKGDSFINHPTSNQRIPGFEFPEWDKALEMVEEMARVIPEVRIVGWDLAYSDNGWILVEANARPHFTAVQVPSVDRNYKNFEPIIKDYKEKLNDKKN